MSTQPKAQSLAPRGLQLLALLLAFSIALPATLYANTLPPRVSDAKLQKRIEATPGTWYQGTIHAVTGDAITISDVVRVFAKPTLFVSKYGDVVSVRYFAKGKRVAFLLDKEYLCAIVMEL